MKLIPGKLYEVTSPFYTQYGKLWWRPHCSPDPEERMKAKLLRKLVELGTIFLFLGVDLPDPAPGGWRRLHRDYRFLVVGQQEVCFTQMLEQHVDDFMSHHFM